MTDIFDQIHAQAQSKPQSGSGDIFDQIHTAEQSKHTPPPSPSASLTPNLGHIYTPPLKDSGFFSENGFGPGTFGRGVGEVLQPGSRMKGAHDMFTGAGEMALPLLPAAVMANPAATITGLAGAGVAGPVGKIGSSLLGASPETSDVIGDVSGLAGGYGGARLGGAVHDIAMDPAVQEAAMKFSPYRKVVDLGHSIMNNLRGPVQGPELAPKGFQSPYPTLPYERPLPAMVPRPAFQGQNFTTPQFSEPSVGNYSGVRLPTGRVVGGPRPDVVELPSRETAPMVDTRSSSYHPISQSRIPTSDEVEFENTPKRFVDPRESQIMAKPLPSSTADTPASARARANTSRAKFDENGKRNQLK